MSPLPSALLCFTVAVSLPAGLCEAQQENSPLPKGYREVGPDKVVDLQQLCEATAETGLFSGAVLVADKGEVIYQQAVGLAASATTQSARRKLDARSLGTVCTKTLFQ